MRRGNMSRATKNSNPPFQTCWNLSFVSRLIYTCVSTKGLYVTFVVILRGEGGRFLKQAVAVNMAMWFPLRTITVVLLQTSCCISFQSILVQNSLSNKNWLSNINHCHASRKVNIIDIQHVYIKYLCLPFLRWVVKTKSVSSF